MPLFAGCRRRGANTGSGIARYLSDRGSCFGEAVSAIVISELDHMKRKAQPKSEQVVPAEILEQAKRSVSEDRLKKAPRCAVCGAETSIAGPEPLCWVCRRLKISAGREIEQQIPAQEYPPRGAARRIGFDGLRYFFPLPHQRRQLGAVGFQQFRDSPGFLHADEIGQGGFVVRDSGLEFRHLLFDRSQALFHPAELDRVQTLVALGGGFRFG